MKPRKNQDKKKRSQKPISERISTITNRIMKLDNREKIIYEKAHIFASKWSPKFVRLEAEKETLQNKLKTIENKQQKMEGKTKIIRSYEQKLGEIHNRKAKYEQQLAKLKGRA